MAYPPLPRLLNNPLYPVLCYSDHFSFPLTAPEIWFWQVRTRFSLPQVRRSLSFFPSRNHYYFLPGRESLVFHRLSRRLSSRAKWQIAVRLTGLLKKFPTVSAVFITGALAMDNSPVNDDIDIMVITSPYSLWFTRFFVSLYLKLLGSRRDPHLPEHSSPRVKDKICDNLWLDSRHLDVFSRNLYHAHEILQAKCLFDRGDVRRRFLTANSWVGDYLPVAFTRTLSSFRSLYSSSDPLSLLVILYFPLNLLFFFLQYLYMSPHLSKEKIGLGYALFHPRPTPEYDMM